MKSTWLFVAALIAVHSINICAMAQSEHGLNNLSANSVSHRTNSSSIDVQHCMVFPIEDIDVPARISGQLMSISVREGQSVEKDQLLAKVDDRIAQLQLQAAKDKLGSIEYRASNDSKIRHAKASLEVARIDHEDAKRLARTSAVSQHQLRRAAFSESEALIAVENATHEHNQVQKEVILEKQNVAIAEAQTEQFLISAPTKGTVKKLYLSAGEWVQAGDKVMQVVRMDKLWVEGFVEADKYDPYEIDGRKVSVTATFANNTIETFDGKIIFVGLTKSVAGRFVVRAEITNVRAGDGSHWLLLPGSSVQMSVHLE